MDILLHIPKNQAYITEKTQKIMKKAPIYRLHVTMLQRSEWSVVLWYCKTSDFTSFRTVDAFCYDMGIHT